MNSEPSKLTLKSLLFRLSAVLGLCLAFWLAADLVCSLAR